MFHMQLPEPRGPLAVGRTSIVLVDSSRADPWIPTERRHVIVGAWYPAERGDAVRRTEYLPHASELPGNFDFGERWVTHRIGTHAFDAPAVSHRQPTYPVLLFSPGNDVAIEYYSALLEELASHGYIVLAIDHAHEGKGQILPDGRRLAMEVDRHRPPDGPATSDFYRDRTEWRAADASFLISRLNTLDALLAGHLDAAHVGAFGHSVGGVAAMTMCRRDARIRACVNLDGLMRAKPIIPENGSYALEQPVLFLGKPLPFPNPAVRDSMHRELDAALASGHGGAWDVTVGETHHDTFTDTPFYTPTLRPTRNRANLEIVRDVVLSFFDKTLRGMPAPLLDESSTMRDGRVRITRLGPLSR